MVIAALLVLSPQLESEIFEGLRMSHCDFVHGALLSLGRVVAQ